MKSIDRAGTIGLVVQIAIVVGAWPAHANWPARADRYVAVSAPATNTGVIDACADGAGGSFVAWGSGRPAVTVFVEHLDTFGRCVFPGGPWIPAPDSETAVHLASDGSGGVIALVVRYPYDGTYGLDAVRIGADKGLLWTRAVWQGTAANEFDWAREMSDPAGATIVWMDGGPPVRIRAQRLDALGAPQWGETGVVVATGSSSLQLDLLRSDGLAGAWVAYVDGLAPMELRLQHLGADGTPAWPDTGMLVETSTSSISAWDLCTDGMNGAYISFVPSISPDRIQRVRFDGSLAFGADGLIPAGPLGAIAQLPSLGTAPDGHVIVAWQSSEGGEHATRVRMLDSTGTWLWPGEGVLVAKSPAAGIGTRVYPNSDGSATVTVQPAMQIWGAICGGQRLNANGGLLWTDPPPALMQKTDAFQDYYAQEGWFSLPNGDGGITFFHTLADSGMGFDESAYAVRAQHLDPYGRLGDTSPRIVSLVDAPQDQGGELELRWHASSLEGDTSMAIVGYDLLREQNDGASGTTLTVVAQRAATGDTEYVALVPTLADSTSPASARTVIRVRAHDGAGRTWLSPPDSASSFADAPVLAVGPPSAPVLALATPEPSPVTSETRVRYTLPVESVVSLALFDAAGRRVRTVASGVQAAGEHAVRLSVASGAEGALAPGLYFVRLALPGRSLARRLVVIR